MASRVVQVQDQLKRQILIENVSSYVTFTQSTLTEWQFLAELCERADCGLLLDVNNVFVSAFNHGFDADEFIDGIPVGRVGQIHLAGHSDHGTHLLDTHDHSVCDGVWACIGARSSASGACRRSSSGTITSRRSKRCWPSRRRRPPSSGRSSMPALRDTEELFWKLISAPEGVADGLRQIDMKPEALGADDRRRRAARRRAAARHLRQHVLLAAARHPARRLHGRRRPPSVTTTSTTWSPTTSSLARRSTRRCATSGAQAARVSEDARARDRAALAGRAGAAGARAHRAVRRARRRAGDAGRAARAGAGRVRRSCRCRWCRATRFVAVEHAVDDVWRAVENEQPIEPPAAGARTLLVWRQELTVYHRPLEPLEKTALDAGARRCAVRRRVRSVRRVDADGRGGPGGVPAACALGGGRYHRAIVIALLLGRFHALTRGAGRAGCVTLTRSRAWNASSASSPAPTTAARGATRSTPRRARRCCGRRWQRRASPSMSCASTTSPTTRPGSSTCARAVRGAGRRRARAGVDDAGERQPRGASAVRRGRLPSLAERAGRAG